MSVNQDIGGGYTLHVTTLSGWSKLEVLVGDIQASRGVVTVIMLDGYNTRVPVMPGNTGMWHVLDNAAYKVYVSGLQYHVVINRGFEVARSNRGDTTPPKPIRPPPGLE